MPEDNNVNKSSKIPLRAPNSEELRKMDKEEKKQEKKKRHKQRVNNGKGVKKDKKEEVKDEKYKEGDKNFDEKNPLDALGSTVIKTIYNNQILNEQTIVLNNNQNAQFTASRQGAKDLENMRFLNSTELSKNNSNHQQKFLTNSPPDNMNLINNIPSSASNDKNPYNQDLSNSNAISYRIQNVEIKANIQQNGPMPKDSKNFNLNNNVKNINNNNSSRYNLGLASQAENDNRYNVNEREQNPNSHYSSSIGDNKSNVTFGNQKQISHNNNNNNVEYSKEQLSKISNQNFSPTQSYAYNYSYTEPAKSSQP